MTALLDLIPRTKFVGENDIFDQLRHVRSEADEAMDAYIGNEDAVRIAEELVDTLISSSTGLRIMAEKYGVDIAAVFDYVVDKDRARGYFL